MTNTAVPSNAGIHQYYRHSGRVPAAAWFVGIPAALAGSVAIGAADGFLGFWGHLIPHLKLAFLAELMLTLGVGFLLGFVPAAILKGFKTRSTTAVLGITAICIAVAYYVSWVCWSYAFLNYSQLDVGLAFIAQPPVLIDFVGALAEEGSWYLTRGHAPSGLFLGLIWLVEIGTIAGIAFYQAHRRITSEVFCENCGKWGTRQQLTQVRTTDAQALKRNLESGRFEALATAEPKRFSDSTWCVVDLEGCAQCDTLQTLRLDYCTQTVNKEGKASIKVEPLIRRLLLTPEQTVQLAMMAAAAKNPVVEESTETSTDEKSCPPNDPAVT